MSLHVESSGSGAPLLLIHGWGMHGGMWRVVTAPLAQHFRVLALDLPGHGYSKRVVPLTLDAIVDELAVQFDEPLAICGWSLGGQIALRWAARYPQKIKRLALIACSPCFVARQDWPCPMPADVLTEFATALQQDGALTLRRFLALQTRGGEREREVLAALRAMLFSHGTPDLQALQEGLELLRDVDLRSTLAEIKPSVLVMAGAQDTLVPLAASQYLSSQIPNAQLEVINGAAHVPFLSHPDEFAERLIRFYDGSCV